MAWILHPLPCPEILVHFYASTKETISNVSKVKAMSEVLKVLISSKKSKPHSFIFENWKDFNDYSNYPISDLILLLIM